ncbi:MAG: maltose alpha-D-glucosyltransferase [Chloroflexi bacterium]|nr:maltose alpha-D-glucosyltransferase [Chloroflexota bacterium]
MSASPVGSPFAPDPQWYKDAIIYQVHVRAFLDSNGDGIGDFPGLAQKLDYLADLGVTALWVMPFYPSPGKDDGYDIADFETVKPEFGTLRDVRHFVREAHRRGLRVITELVANHTSDQHRWFQRARRAAPGSPERDFYVWSDTPERYTDARIIFKDFEPSNWSWDPVAGAYYWHRFYAHQPDLNFDNPKVREAILRTLDFWLEMGVDGLRLDAIPYLYEREGTNCENLPETHAFLRDLRRHIAARFADRMLLAEANQWPDDAVAYFGAGDECHMAFHFPIMPRLFMALRMEDRFPVIDILDQTPAIPDNAQWALFLRNHDELTLEMVTDEERDYMYRVYAADPQARINLGIRRRLAPLLGHDRRRIELLNALLLSLPGTPVVYYGDEIGMGDNVYLGDRNGVRTPMQWSPDRNAGFSDANRQRLYLPVITDPEYHYEAVNVAAQQENPHSLLWWMKRLIALRKRHPAFGRGSIEFVQPDNRRVLAFVRRHGDETLLVVANLARYAQWARLDLSAFEGLVPVELFGSIEFPPIGSDPYTLTLGPHGFLWFSLETRHPVEIVPASATELPALPRPRALRDLVTGEGAARLAPVVGRWIRGRRWFRGKAKTVTATDIVDGFPVELPGREAVIALVRVAYVEGEPELYAVPLTIAEGALADRLRRESLPAVVARIDGDGAVRSLLIDASVDEAFADALLGAIGGRRRLKGRRGEIVGVPTRGFRGLRGPGAEPLSAVPVRAEQSNTSIVYGDRLILKLYRALEDGENPDLEIGRFLTERAFPNVPAVAGALEYRRPGAAPATFAILQAFVPNEGDLWDVTLDAVNRYLESALTRPEPPSVEAITPALLLERASATPPEEVQQLIGGYPDTAWLLGRRLGELHSVLADPDGPAAFAPEPMAPFHQRSLYQSIRASIQESMRLLERRRGTIADELLPLVEATLAASPNLEARLRPLLERRLGGMRIRCHGDFHAGQTLFTGRDIMLIDFEGEPARPLSERRLKRPALTDVAGMLSSYRYAASTPVVERRLRGETDDELATVSAWTRLWFGWVAAAFLRGYREATAGAAFLPRTDDAVAALLEVLLIQKGAYELRYELESRPDWVGVPLTGLLALLEGV